jgi:hypothetical protein
MATIITGNSGITDQRLKMRDQDCKAQVEISDFRLALEHYTVLLYVEIFSE